MSRLGKDRQLALRQAAQPHRRMDGTYNRAGLQAVADTNGISLSSLRRILAAEKASDMPAATPADSLSAAHRAALVGLDGLNEEQKMLLACGMGGGSSRTAHQWACAHIGYAKSYRQFMRDIDKLDPALRAGMEGGWTALVDERLYLSTTAPHRNHAWHMDHTQADIYVLPDRGGEPFRPWVTIIVDKATNMYLALEAWDGRPNSDRVATTLTRAATGDWSGHDTPLTVGGLPVMLVMDNAAEHLSDAMRQGCLKLGIVAAPTTPHHSWENGVAEVAHLCVTQDFLATMPGYTGAGTDKQGDPRFSPTPDGSGGYRTPMQLLRFSQFRALLEEYRISRNATKADSNGRTPLDRWKADPTPLTPMEPALMRSYMTQADRAHTVNKAGIRFRGVDYTCRALAPYRRKKVNVRYMNTVTDWIEVFDGNAYIGRAWRADRLPEAERLAVLEQRKKTTKEFRELEQRTRQTRAHFAMALNEGWDPKSLPEPPSLADHLKGEADNQALPAIRSTTPHVDRREPALAMSDIADKLLAHDNFTLEGDIT